MSDTHPLPQVRRPGRPPSCPREILIRVVELRRQGLSYGAIAAVLNREGVPTPGGGTLWYKSCVDRLLHTRYAMELMEELSMSQQVHL